MPGQRRCPADLFLRWPISFLTGLPRSCSGSMRNSGPGIPFAKPRGWWKASSPAIRPITPRCVTGWEE